MHSDFIPEMQKTGRDGFWEIHNDLFAVDVQIEGQLGHTLGGGKEKKKGGKKELKTLEVCPQKRVPQTRERRSKQENTQKIQIVPPKNGSHKGGLREPPRK